jgi:hypothetical protein
MLKLKIHSCDSEERLCLGSDVNDGSFQTYIRSWHSACDDVITFSPTTPALSSITVPYDPKFCNTVLSSCARASISAAGCDGSYTGQQYSSCICQPPLFSLQYTCEFLGNTSCLLTTAALTGMAAYGLCPNLVDVLGGGNASVSA